MATIKFGRKKIEVDDNGHLVNHKDWKEKLAIQLAGEDGLILTENHWEILLFLRDYYKEYTITPVRRVFSREFGRKTSSEKGDSQYLYGHFSGGIKQACRIAGLPRPIG